MAALLISLLAAIFFHRFDPAHERRKRSQIILSADALEERTVGVSSPRPIHLRRLTVATLSGQFVAVLFAELTLMLKGRSLWWYLVAVALLAASLVVPLTVAWQYLLPIIWVWPVLIWSAMGNREVFHQTHQLVFSTAYPLRRQLPASWLAGVLIALFTGSGVGVRLVAAGHGTMMLAWGVAAVFIPTLALTLGIWSGSSKLFEAVYMLLWYLGPINKLLPLDFIGSSPAAIKAGVPFYYLVGTCLLLVFVVIGRRRQLQMD